MIKQFPVVLIPALFLMSCRQETNSSQLRLVSESLQRSNEIAIKSIELCNWTMESKLRDNCTRPEALTWLPKMIAIQAAANSTINYLDTIKNALVRQSLPGQERYNKQIQDVLQRNGPNFLFEKLRVCKSSMVSAITEIDFADNSFRGEMSIRDSIQFAKSLPLLYSYTDSTLRSDAASARQWYDSSFVNSNMELILVMLDKIKSDLLISEYTLATYCLRRTSVLCCGVGQFFPLVVVSSSNIKAGDAIEVSAGIGEFNAAAKPDIFIDGKNILVGPEGVAQYTIRPSKAPGKYSIPVKVEYYKPDGTRVSLSKNVFYNISE